MAWYFIMRVPTARKFCRLTMTIQPNLTSRSFDRPSSAPTRTLEADSLEGQNVDSEHLKRIKQELHDSRESIESVKQHLQWVKIEAGVPNPSELEKLYEVTQKLSRFRLGEVPHNLSRLRFSSEFPRLTRDALSSDTSMVGSPNSLTPSETILCDEFRVEELENDCQEMLGLISQKSESIENKLAKLAKETFSLKRKMSDSILDRQSSTIDLSMLDFDSERVSIHELFHPDLSPK